MVSNSCPVIAQQAKSIGALASAEKPRSSQELGTQDENHDEGSPIIVCADFLHAPIHPHGLCLAFLFYVHCFLCLCGAAIRNRFLGAQ